MSPSGDPATIETLLEQAEWLRTLSKQLVGADDDDAIQDTWEAALRSPPDANRPPRPWLVRVVLNATRKRFRDDSRRRAVEEKVTELAAQVPTPEQSLERAQIQKLLVDRVLALDEPVRRVVLLRYFEGLSSADIARALNIPPGTVRWRLKEGIDRLRASLDSRHGGREGWTVLLSPIAFVPDGRWAPIGAVLMATKTKLALVGGLTVLAGVLVFAVPRCHEPTGSTSASKGIGENIAPPDAQRARMPSHLSAALRESDGGTVEVDSTRNGSAVVPPASVAREPARATGGQGTEAARIGTPPPAQVTRGDAGIRYPISREGIGDAVKSTLPGIRDCYEEWLKVQPAIGGRVRATFTIDTDDGVEGKVDAVSLGDAGIGHFAMEGCILSALQGLRFDAPLEGPINVTYPLTLAPSADGGR